MKAEAVSAKINQEAGATGGSLEVLSLNLADLSGVREVAKKLVESGKPFDAIIANAGIMATPFSRTVDGFENQFGTNHLGHFVLVNKLVSLLHTGARIVNLSSGAHRFSNVDLEDPNFECTPYNAWIAYGRSKTANSLFAVELDRRLQGRGITAASIKPGVIPTELSRDVAPEDLSWFQENVVKALEAAGAALHYKNIPQGAATTVWAAFIADAEEIGGKYCEDCHVSPVIPSEVPSLGEGVFSYAVDPETAQRLWKKSEELVGEHFA